MFLDLPMYGASRAYFSLIRKLRFVLSVLLVQSSHPSTQPGPMVGSKLPPWALPPWNEGTSLSPASWAYMFQAIISWRVLFMQYTPWVFCLALLSEGRIIAAKIAIMAM